MSDKPVKQRKRKIDLSTALDLKVNHDLTYEEIGKLQGVSKQAIQQALKDLIPDRKSIETYQEKRADILDNVQLKFLTQLDDERLKSASLRDVMIGFGVAYDKSRLERDKSTDNISMIGKLISDVQRARSGESDV